jgi:hypothetical protein
MHLVFDYRTDLSTFERKIEVSDFARLPRPLHECQLETERSRETSLKKFSGSHKSALLRATDGALGPLLA